MTQERLRIWVSAFLLAAHIGVPALLVGFFLADGFTKEELTEALTIVVPMLSVISGMAVAYIISAAKKRRPIRTAKLSGLYVITAVALPVAFVGLIATVSALKAYNVGLKSFDDFKILLAAIETVFGAYTGSVVTSLFSDQKKEA